MSSATHWPGMGKAASRIPAVAKPDLSEVPEHSLTRRLKSVSRSQSPHISGPNSGSLVMSPCALLGRYGNACDSLEIAMCRIPTE